MEVLAYFFLFSFRQMRSIFGLLLLPLFAISLLLSFLDVRADIKAEEVVVSLSIDSSSLEVQREALRLLTSLFLFGGTLKEAHISICINYDEDIPLDVAKKESHVLVEQILLLEFENLLIDYSRSLPYPEYALSLNKMCAFAPNIDDGHEIKYLLYLDADIFVAQDPLPFLQQYLPLLRQAPREYSRPAILW